MIRRDYLIIGAGIGGASLCEGIREYDKKGTIMMVGAESFLPYHRPQLLRSQLAKTAAPVEKIQPHDADWYRQQHIDLRLDTQVLQINLERRLAVLTNGQAIEFRKAGLAMGSRSRRPQVAGATVGNVFYLRTLRDVQALREVAELEHQIAVIGGSYLGCEAAAALAQFPKAQVTLMHRGKQLFNRILDEETGAWLTAYFGDHGVKLLMGEQLNGFEGRTVLKNVQTKSGARFGAGLAVVAVGTEPNLGLVANTPLSYPHGTPVNDYLETDEKGIFAVGDIAFYPDKVFGGGRRIDHWACTIAQGHVAGANLTGKKRIRWEWMPHHTCQLFDLHFDFVGDFTRLPTRVELEGDRTKKKFVLKYFQLNALMGVLLCNQPPERAEAAKTEIRSWPRGKKSTPVNDD